MLHFVTFYMNKTKNANKLLSLNESLLLPNISLQKPERLARLVKEPA